MNHSNNLRKRVGAKIWFALLLSALATAGYAGEITGNGKSLKDEDGMLNGNSACAFSGLNDTYTGDPTEPDEDGFFRTQSWGQFGKGVRDFLTSIGVSPGNSCNPTRSEGEPG